MESANPQRDAPLGGTANNVDRAGLVAIIWTCFGVATTFASARIAVRLHTSRRLQIDDWWIVLAWAAMLTMCIIETIAQDAVWYALGLLAGRFMPEMDSMVWDLEQLARWQFASIKLFFVCLWSVKASFLALFYRVVQPFTTRRRLWYVITTFVTLSFIGCVISSVLTCDPPSNYFKFGKCSGPADLRRQHFNILFATVLDIVSDVVIVSLPLSVLPILNLDKRKKIGLGIIFTLSLFVVCVSVVRMTQVIVRDAVDVVGLIIWSTVETATAVIIGSLPALSGLLTKGVRKYKNKKIKRNMIENDFHPQDSYPLGSRSRTVMMAESIPLDDSCRSEQLDGGIYVQTMFETHIEVDADASSRDDLSDIAIVKSVEAKC